ncbi:MAG: phosphoribosylamine--glycine ligase [Candidatus Thermoplasmatota archaeon]|nr:phosphoribosylamine--glycine ligase [Candidatus Thermoplasmatota archaeon]
MKVLVIGSGGREHAIAWKLRKSRWVSRVICAPGNAGTGRMAENIPVKDSDLKGIVELARAKEMDLVVVGPEAPLAQGLVDMLEREGIGVFGPTREASKLESSKVFSKRFMVRNRIPTAKAEAFDELKEVRKYIRDIGGPMVIKVDGLAAGKGAFPCETETEAYKALDRISTGEFGTSAGKVLVEEYLRGEEASILAFSDGRTILPMESAQDHKRAFDNDSGPNTGGMGAYSPAPVVTDEISSRVFDEVLLPTVKGMSKLGTPYKGLLYAGLMITDQGPKVIEFNCRFGDPEAQAVIPRLATDFVRPLKACCDGELDRVTLRWSRSSSVCVVMASQGYPGKYDKGHIISGTERAERMENVAVFHSGTALNGNGELVTNGGRVLGVTGMAPTVPEAIRLTYQAVRKIDFKGAFYRKDIGQRALDHLASF